MVALPTRPRTCGPIARTPPWILSYCAARTNKMEVSTQSASKHENKFYSMAAVLWRTCPGAGDIGADLIERKRLALPKKAPRGRVGHAAVWLLAADRGRQQVHGGAGRATASMTFDGVLLAHKALLRDVAARRAEAKGGRRLAAAERLVAKGRAGRHERRGARRGERRLLN